MKKNNILLAFLAVILFFGACSDFEEINKDPNAANEDDIKVQYIINKAITDAQQDPHIAERAFVLYWRRAGRQDRSSGINLGTNNNDWSSDYYSYVSGWMKSATQAVDLADKQLEKDNFAVEYDRQMTKNLKEVARIWRVYLMSEFADNFGPLPIEAFKGKNPEFASVKDVYYFMLDELKDATQNIDPSIQVQDIDKKFDRAYQFDFTKWTKYANSMRMRLAMRLSEVDPEKAKSEFEDAAKGSLILTENDMFAVQERDGWDPLAGVMSRPWNALLMSNTLNNLMINLGGVKSEDMLDASYAAHIKPEGYMGIRLRTSSPHTPTILQSASSSMDFTIPSTPEPISSMPSRVISAAPMRHLHPKTTWDRLKSPSLPTRSRPRRLANSTWPSPGTRCPEAAGATRVQ